MRTLRVAVSATALLAGLAGCGRDAIAPEAEIQFAHFTDPQQIADSSEYLVTAMLTSRPEPYALAADPQLRYWVSDATITGIIAQRPDAPTVLRPGQTVAIGTELLSSSRTTAGQAGDSFPTEVDVPAVGDKIVAFLVWSRDLADYGAGYDAVGQGVVGGDGTVRIRAVPGPLNHTQIPLSTLTTGQMPARFESAAGWRAPSAS